MPQERAPRRRSRQRLLPIACAFPFPLRQPAHACPQVAIRSLPNKTRTLSEVYLTIVPHVRRRRNRRACLPLSDFPTPNNLLPSSPTALAPRASLDGRSASGEADGSYRCIRTACLGVQA